MASLLTLELDRDYTRPVVRLKDDISCLIDTGADTPVWTQGEQRLRDAYKTELIADKKFLLSGFGKNTEIVAVYRIYNLCLEGKGERIVFKSLVLACTDRPTMVADLILPATAFANMNYTVKNIEVDYPIIEILHEREEYVISPIYRVDNTGFVDRVYSFAND